MIITGACGQALIQNQDNVLCNETDNVWVWYTSWGNFFVTTNVMFATGYCANTMVIFFTIPRKRGLFDESDSTDATTKNGYQANVSINSIADTSTIQQNNQFTMQT